MTDEGMKLLRERIQNFLSQCSPHMKDRGWHKLLVEAKTYLSSHREPHPPASEQPDAPDEISTLKCRLREAEAHVKELRGRFQLCNEERERQHTRAEAAERGKEK